MASRPECHARTMGLLAVLLFGCSSPAASPSVTHHEEHDFILNCAGCHRLDGTGSTTVPSLHGIKDLGASADVRDYLIRVPGVAQAPLSDRRLAELMNWVVERFTGNPPVPRYVASEVAALRSRPLLDPLAARASLTEPVGAQPTAILTENR